MLTLHQRSKLAQTIANDRNRHARTYRDCLEDDEPDDGLRAARGVVNGLAIMAVVWALLFVGVWAAVTLADLAGPL